MIWFRFQNGLFPEREVRRIFLDGSHLCLRHMSQKDMNVWNIDMVAEIGEKVLHRVALTISKGTEQGSGVVDVDGIIDEELKEFGKRKREQIKKNKEKKCQSKN